MNIVVDVSLLALKALVFFLLANLMIKFDLFFNYYTVILFCLSVSTMGASAFGIRDTLLFFVKCLLPSIDFQLNDEMPRSFYRFSYLSGLIIFVGGLIIILSDLQRMLLSDNNHYEAFAINLLPFLYSIFFAEFFFYPLKIRSNPLN